jgi:hypothetical protein
MPSAEQDNILIFNPPMRFIVNNNRYVNIHRMYIEKTYLGDKIDDQVEYKISVYIENNDYLELYLDDFLTYSMKIFMKHFSKLDRHLNWKEYGCNTKYMEDLDYDILCLPYGNRYNIAEFIYS